MSVTIYDVAKAAGVSIATVSQVVNNTGNMRDSTRQRVLKVIEELEYHPNVMATALTGKETKTIGLIVPDISNPFFSNMAKSIEDYAHEKEMSVIICSTNYDRDKEHKYIKLLKQKRVDGFIIASTFKDQSLFEKLIKKKKPLVLLSIDDPSIEVSKVSIDDFQGGFLATNHLIEKGHRNIAIVAEEAYSSRKRIYGYREAHEQANITLKEKNILHTTATIENGKRIFRKLIGRGEAERPTAIFASNDLLAIGIIHEATQHQIHIPEDISVVGFDNTILASTSVPGLTSVAQPMEDMGRKSVEVLINQIENDDASNERFLYNPELIIRETTMEKK